MFECCPLISNRSTRCDPAHSVNYISFSAIFFNICLRCACFSGPMVLVKITSWRWSKKGLHVGNYHWQRTQLQSLKKSLKPTDTKMIFFKADFKFMKERNSSSKIQNIT